MMGSHSRRIDSRAFAQWCKHALVVLGLVASCACSAAFSSGCSGNGEIKRTAESSYVECSRLSRHGQYPAATAACGQALESDPNHVEARLLLIRLLQRTGQVRVGLEHAQRLIKIAPESVAAHEQLGMTYARLGMNDSAIAAYRTAIGHDPSRSQLYRLLSVILVDQDQYTDAIDLLNKSIELDGGRAMTFHNMGMIYERQSRYVDAQAAFERAILLDSTYAGSHYNMGLIHTKLGRYAEAEVALQRALRQDPQHAGAHTARGQLLQQQGNLPEAEAAYMKAISGDPFEKEAYHRLGRVLAMQQRGEEAEKIMAAFERLREVEDKVLHFRYMIEMFPGDSRAHYNLGVLYGQIGHYPAAEAEYERALVINPKDQSSRNNLANIQMRAGQFERAIQNFEMLLKEKPQYVRAWINLGNALMATGNLDRATAHFEQAVKVQPDFAEAHRSLSEAYRQQEKEAESKKEQDVYEKLLAQQSEKKK